MKGGAMISRGLRAALVVEALLSLLTMTAWVGGGTLTPWVLLVACGGFFALNAGAIIAVYAILSRYVATYAPVGAGRARTWSCAGGELLALFAAFVVIQPFERWWMGEEAVGRVAAERIPILLVHGYLCNRGIWWRLRRHLRARQFAVATINLEPPLSGLDQLAERLSERVDALLAEAGAEKVMLLTHSMGGLVSRAYLQAHGAARVARLVTLAAPHHGTQIARLGCGRNAHEMRPDSEWLRRLNAGPSPQIPIANIWTRNDEIVTPPGTSRLIDARETILSGVGHMAMLFSPTIFAQLEAELAQS
jgi:triacylglycerol lipase